MADNRSKFSFEEELEKLVNSFDTIDNKLDSTNIKLKETATAYNVVVESLKNILNVINNLQNSLSLKGIDGRKTRPLETMAKHLEKLVSVLSTRGVDQAITSGHLNTSIQGILNAVEQLKNISQTDQNLKTFAGDMEDVNKQLGEFVGLAGALKALDITKLAKLVASKGLWKELGVSEQDILDEVVYNAKPSRKGITTYQNPFESYKVFDVIEDEYGRSIDPKKTKGTYNDIYTNISSIASNYKYGRAGSNKDLAKMLNSLTWMLDNGKETGGYREIKSWLADQGLEMPSELDTILSDKSTSAPELRTKVGKWLEDNLSQEAIKKAKRAKEKDKKKNETTIDVEGKNRLRETSTREKLNRSQSAKEAEIQILKTQIANEPNEIAKTELKERLIKKEKAKEYERINREADINATAIRRNTELKDDEKVEEIKRITKIRQLEINKATEKYRKELKEILDIQKRLSTEQKTQYEEYKERARLIEFESKQNKLQEKIDKQREIANSKKPGSLEQQKEILKLHELEKQKIENEKGFEQEKFKRLYKEGKISKQEYDFKMSFGAFRDRRIKTGPAPGWVKDSIPARLVVADKEIEKDKERLARLESQEAIKRINKTTNRTKIKSKREIELGQKRAELQRKLKNYSGDKNSLEYFKLQKEFNDVDNNLYQTKAYRSDQTRQKSISDLDKIINDKKIDEGPKRIAREKKNALKKELEESEKNRILQAQKYTKSSTKLDEKIKKAEAKEKGIKEEERTEKQEANRTGINDRTLATKKRDLELEKEKLRIAQETGNLEKYISELYKVANAEAQVKYTENENEYQLALKRAKTAEDIKKIEDKRNQREKEITDELYDQVGAINDLEIEYTNISKENEQAKKDYKERQKQEKADAKAEQEFNEKYAKAKQEERKRREAEERKQAEYSNKEQERQWKEKQKEKERQEKAEKKRKEDNIKEETTASTYNRRQFKKDADLIDKQRIYKKEQEKAKEAAWERLAGWAGGGLPFGIDLQKIEDVETILGIKKGNTLGAMKAKRNLVNANYNAEIERVDNEEKAEIEKIKHNQELSPEQKQENIEKLRNTMSEKRQNLLEDREKELSKIDSGIAKISSNIGQWLGFIAIGIKILKGIFAVANQSNVQNNKIANALTKMGYTQSGDLTYKQIIDQNLSTEWTEFRRAIGQGALGEAVSGLKLFGTNLLQAGNWLIGRNQDVSNNALDVSTEVFNNVNNGYLERIIKDLEDKGININGKSLRISAEETASALEGAFNTSRQTGLSSRSARYLAGALNELAKQIKVNNPTESYSDIMNNLVSSMTGGNATTQYGLPLTDNMLVGFGAYYKEMDMANVEYTDAMKEHIRVQALQHLASITNQEDRDAEIKKLEQLGDVMNTTAGQLYDFQEVQQTAAKDFTIPEIGEGNTILNTGYATNDMLKDQDKLLIKTSKGVMNLKDTYKFLGGDLSRLLLVYNDLTGQYELITDDYLATLTAEEKAHLTIIDKGIVALAIYADMLGISDDKLHEIAVDAGLSQKDIEDLDRAVANIPNGSFEITENIDSVMQKIEELRRRLAELRGGTTVNENGFSHSSGKFDTKESTKWSSTEWGTLIGGAVGTMFPMLIPGVPMSPAAGINGALLGGLFGTVMDNKSNGGISVSNNLDKTSALSREVVVPADSEEGVKALSRALTEAKTEAEIKIENININNDVGIAEDTPTWNRVAKKMADAIATIQRREGDANYGIRK